jgi:hypothetical protein
MKFAWLNTIPNLAAWNSDDIEEIIIRECEARLGDDGWQDDFDHGFDSDVGPDIITVA